MSYVTNIILNMGIYLEPEDKQKLKEVNTFFEDTKGFVLVDDESLPSHWYGGQKMLECSLAIGAFNYINLKELIEHLKKIEWEYPKSVQLIVQDQDDEKFSIIDIFS